MGLPRMIISGRLVYWRLNSQGNIVGRIYGHKVFDEGATYYIQGITSCSEYDDCFVVKTAYETFELDKHSEQIVEPKNHEAFKQWEDKIKKLGRA